MRNRIARLLARLANRLSTDGSVTMVLDVAFLQHARRVVRMVELDVPGAAPENKHARAFGILMRYPGATKRQASMAIVLALEVEAIAAGR